MLRFYFGSMDPTRSFSVNYLVDHRLKIQSHRIKNNGQVGQVLDTFFYILFNVFNEYMLEGNKRQIKESDLVYFE